MFKSQAVTVNMEINNRFIKIKHWIEMQLEFTLNYITLINYYIVKDTFRS